MKKEKIEELELTEEIKHNNIYAALAAFQQDVPQLIKNTKGYGYNYTDLSEIIKIINPYMQKHGLGFTQPLQKNENNGIRTIIFHVDSSQTIESFVDLIEGVQLKGMNDFQVYGNAISYFRRYSLVSILGLVSDKDTDASGEQIRKQNILSPERFIKALDAIKKGDYTKEELKEKYDLTIDQISQL